MREKNDVKTTFIRNIEAKLGVELNPEKTILDSDNFLFSPYYYSVPITQEVFADIRRNFKAYKLKIYVKEYLWEMFDLIITDCGKDIFYQVTYSPEKDKYTIIYTDIFDEFNVIFAFSTKYMTDITVNNNTIKFSYKKESRLFDVWVKEIALITKEQYIKDLFIALRDMKVKTQIVYERRLFSKNESKEISWEKI